LIDNKIELILLYLNNLMDIIVPTCEESVTDPSFGNVTYDKVKYYTYDPTIESDNEDEETDKIFSEPINIILNNKVVPIVEWEHTYKSPEGSKFTYPVIPIVVTLVTAGCKIEPDLNESIYGPKLRPTTNIPFIESNYGLHVLFDYEIKKRNKRQKETKTLSMSKKRKKSGNGKCMNSCIQYNVKLDKNIEVNAKPGKVYKVKRFRKSNIQIPGGLLENLEDIKDILIKTVNYERRVCRINTRIVNPVSISMINYKFLLTDKYHLKLASINDVFTNIIKEQSDKGLVPLVIKPTTPDEDIYVNNKPFVFNSRFEADAVIIVISFNVPTIDKPQKKIIVRISYKGKVNIQGGMSDRRPTIAIYNYLLELFRKNQDSIFIDIPLSDAEYKEKYGCERTLEEEHFDSDDEFILESKKDKDGDVRTGLDEDFNLDMKFALSEMS
jgi:hypothetical protein